MGSCISRRRPRFDRRRRMIKNSLRKTIKKLFNMNIGANPNLKLLTNRVGHVSVQYEDQLVIVWGGYDRSHEDGEGYYDPSQIVMMNTKFGLIQTFETMGAIPPKTCGATAVMFDKHMYVIGGFVSGDEFEDPDQQCNTNAIYRLNVATKVWHLVNPKLPKNSPNLLKADKLSAWVYGHKIYIYGGYGPIPEEDLMTYPLYFRHVMDPGFFRGWTNQFLVYDTLKNTLDWVWPLGDAPEPRAAHATVCDPKLNRVYLFGGRFGNERLSDLYYGDLANHSPDVKWTRIPREENVPWPCGRSWHTLNLIDSENLILYGGYDTDRKPLNDCWLFKTSTRTWHNLTQHSRTHRLWHTSHFIRSLDSMVLIGGVCQDIATNTLERMHPETVDRLQLSPQSLTQSALQCVRDNPYLYRHIELLPSDLQNQILNTHSYDDPQVID